MKTNIALLLTLAFCISPSVGFAQSEIIKSVVSGGMDSSTGSGSASTASTPEGEWPTARKSGGKIRRGSGPTYSENLPADFFSDPGKGESLLLDATYITAGYLTHDFDSFGEIMDGGTSMQSSFSLTDTIYIDKGENDGVTEGDMFMVVHLSDEKIQHPVKFGSLGRKVIYDGIIKISEVRNSVSKGTIVKVFRGIERGDMIIPYDEAVTAPFIDPDKPIADKSISGYIVAGKEEKQGTAEGDIIYLDIGSEEGVETGDVFDIIDDDKVLTRDGSVVKGLDKIIARARVILVKGASSTAYIFESTGTSYFGRKVIFSQMR